MLGIPGSGVALVVVLAAILAGPLVGVLVALTGGALFYAVVADLGSVGAPVGTLGGTAIWAVAGIVAGSVADSMRASASQRDDERQRAQLFEALEAGLLPRLLYAHPALSVIARYIPSEQRLHLGGDFLDLAEAAAGRLALLIGDVAGHGPGPAALGATLRATWRGLVISGAPPATILATMNHTVREQAGSEDTFVTACLAWLDPQRNQLSFTLLGHPPMVLIDGGGARFLEAAPILPLGVAASLELVLEDVALPRTWSLLAYTDGLIEGRASPGGAQRYGEARMLADLGEFGPCGLSDESVDELLRRVQVANGGPLPDDIALLAITARTRQERIVAGARDEGG